MSTQFNCQKHFYFKLFSLVKQFEFKQFSLVWFCLANHSLQTGSISPQVFYICWLDWLNLSSVQQRHSHFLLCRSQQFSLLPGKTHLSCVLPQVFHFLFVNIARPSISQMILSAVCTSYFFQAIFLHMVQVLFTTFGTCVILYRLPCGVRIFGIWSTSGVLWCTAQLSQDNSQSSPSWDYMADLMSGCKCWSGFVLCVFWWRFFLYL